MPLPSSGQISLGDIANEFDYELSNISLRTLSQKASKGQPDAVSEFYNFTYNYPTVQIVNQVWFSESLRRKKYVDGVGINQRTDASTWAAATTGYYGFVNDTPTTRNEEGLLYNFYAVNDSSGSELCPAGFYIPNNEILNDLVTYSNNVGSNLNPLKTIGTTYWNTANGTNNFGFSAMGSSWIFNSGNYVAEYKQRMLIWGKEFESNANWFLSIRDIYGGQPNIAGSSINFASGFSVRCVTKKSYYFVLLSNGGIYYYDMATNTFDPLILTESGAVGIAMTNNKLWVMFDTSTGLNLKIFTINLALSPISVSLDTTLSYTPDVNIYNGIEKLTSDGSIMYIAGGDRIYTASTVSGGVISTTGSIPITGGSSRGGIALKNDYYVTITKTSGSNNNWNDAQAYSTNGYVDRIVISAYAQQTNAYIMFGLNTDPKTNASYDSIDYAWYFNGSPSEAYIYESGSSVGINAGAYTTSTILTIIYENNEVKYYKDGTLIRSVSRNVGTPLYFDSSIYTLNGSFGLTNFNTFFNIGKNPNVVGTNVTITPSTSRTLYSTFTAGGVQSVYQNSSVLHNINSIANPFAMSCDASFIYIFADNLVYRFTDSIPPQRLNINGTDVVIPIPAETQIFGVAQI
jgi:uncharacterized protein (TIGR02145 family)